MRANYSGRTIPLRMFQSEWLSVSDRMLLVYSSFADEKGRSFIGTRKIAILIGLVGQDGVPTKSQIIQMRNARSLLCRKGVLVHTTEPRKGMRHRDVYTLRADPVTKGAMTLWGDIGSRMKTPCDYKDVEWEAIAGREQKAPLDDGYDIDDLLASEPETTEEDVEDIIDFLDDEES